MKSKAKRILAVLTACVLIILILSITNSFVGNPVSKYLADKSAAKYIKEKYSDLNLEADKAGYNFKEKKYIVRVKSKNSIDTHFAIYCKSTGKVLRDDYEMDVLEGFNTWTRVTDQYHKYVEKLLREKLKYQYDMIIGDVNDKSEPRLEIDKNYDMHDKDLKGSVTVYIYSDNRTWDNVAKVTKEIDKVFSDDNINVDKYTVVLENKDKKGDSMGIYDFDKKLLESDNLPAVMKKFFDEWEKEHDKK